MWFIASCFKSSTPDNEITAVFSEFSHQRSTVKDIWRVLTKLYYGSVIRLFTTNSFSKIHNSVHIWKEGITLQSMHYF